MALQVGVDAGKAFQLVFVEATERKSAVPYGRPSPTYLEEEVLLERGEQALDLLGMALNHAGNGHRGENKSYAMDARVIGDRLGRR